MNIIESLTPKFSFGQPAQPAQPQSVPVDPEKLGPKHVFMAWQAEGRPMQKFLNAKLTRTLAIIGVVLALFFVIMQEYFLILVIVSMVFVAQTLSKAPAEVARYEISSHGISVDEHVYLWQELRRFFFFEEEGYNGLAVDLINGFPARLFINFNHADKEKLTQILGERLHFLDAAPQTMLDKTYKSLADKFTI